MSDAQQQDKASGSFYRIGWGGVFGLTLAGFLIGFIYLAIRDPGATQSWFNDLCRAAGISFTRGPTTDPALLHNKGSTVAWTRTTLKESKSGDVNVGGTLVETCMTCHGAEISVDLNPAPRLDGMDAQSIYKQLVDYRENKRRFPIMNHLAAALSDEDIQNLAAFYASLEPTSKAKKGQASPEIVKLVEVGDASRNIVPCVACHGPQAYKVAAPTLFGLSSDYLEAQLDNFASDTRQNDILAQMRSIAKGLTPEERTGLAKYYGEAK